MLDYKHNDIALDAGILCSTSTLEQRIEEDFDWWLEAYDEDDTVLSVEQFTEYVMDNIDPRKFCKMLADALYYRLFWDEVMGIRDDVIDDVMHDLLDDYMKEIRSGR